MARRGGQVNPSAYGVTVQQDMSSSHRAPGAGLGVATGLTRRAPPDTGPDCQLIPAIPTTIAC
jgi:hypothetical protein